MKKFLTVLLPSISAIMLNTGVISQVKAGEAGCITFGGSNYSGSVIKCYDANGKITSSKNCNFSDLNADGSCRRYSSATDYTYDTNGNMTSSRYCTSFNDDGSCKSYSSGTDYTYDANGNKTSSRECSSLNSNGSCRSYSSGTDYTYDANGNRTSERYCNSSRINSNGNCTSYHNSHDYTYDTNGNMTSSRSCTAYNSNINSDGSCSSYSSGTDYTYDANGNKTEDRRCSSFNSNGSCSSYSYIDKYNYDADGNMTSKKYCETFVNGSCAYRTTEYAYDANGNKILEMSCYKLNDDGSCKEYTGGKVFLPNLPTSIDCFKNPCIGAYRSAEYGTSYFAIGSDGNGGYAMMDCTDNTFTDCVTTQYGKNWNMLAEYSNSGELVGKFDYDVHDNTLVYDDQCNLVERYTPSGVSLPLEYEIGEGLLYDERKTRYTPAEAAEIIGDSEDNMIVMYFK